MFRCLPLNTVLTADMRNGGEGIVLSTARAPLEREQRLASARSASASRASTLTRHEGLDPAARGPFHLRKWQLASSSCLSSSNGIGGQCISPSRRPSIRPRGPIVTGAVSPAGTITSPGFLSRHPLPPAMRHRTMRFALAHMLRTRGLILVEELHAIRVGSGLSRRRETGRQADKRRNRRPTHVAPLKWIK